MLYSLLQQQPCTSSNADLSVPQKLFPDKCAYDLLVCFMQQNARKVGPEVQNALAKQQDEQTQDMAVLQEQLDGLKKALNQQKAAAHAMVQVRTQGKATSCCLPVASRHAWHAKTTLAP